MGASDQLYEYARDMTVITAFGVDSQETRKQSNLKGGGQTHENAGICICKNADPQICIYRFDDDT